MRAAPTPDVVRRLQQPEHGPVWRASLLTLAIILVGDVLTPFSAPLSAGLPVLLFVSLIAASERLTARLTALTIIVSVVTGLINVLRSGTDTGTLLFHLAVTALTVLSGVTATWLARRGTSTPDELLALPHTDVNAPPAERAAHLLAALSGARGHQLHRVESIRDWLARSPHVRPLPAHRVNQRRIPRLPTSARTAPLWQDTRGNIYVRLDLPTHGEALVQLVRPSAPPAFILDATHVLQLQLERAALNEQVHLQREVLRDLVYAFSHDLRTPITANILHAEAALSGLYGPLSDPLAEFLQHSQQGNRDLLTVSDQMMLLAEYESGDLTGEAGSAVELGSVIRSVVGDVQLRGRERGIHFELDLTPCTVIGHMYDLRRAVQNLLENAMKFSPPHAFVKVTLRPDRTSALIEVLDQGPGVPESQVPQLFRRYRSSTRGSGTGFGLYLTQRIAERYGGTVTYTRTDSDHPWTVFQLCLPLAHD
ncbi:sensor histidine kinase [Deinococcus sp. PEB2-63]